ncbi:MAG: DUF5606 domain-containing protein [Bacteroidales bacterium]
MNTINVKDLMSIAGKGGLYRFLAQARNGVIVESLVDKKRTVAPATARVSSLDDISIFAEKEDIPLADVLLRIHQKEEGGVAIDPKSGNEELKKYFSEVLPEYDENRVYVSDIKKVITWYNQLHEMNLLEIVEKKEGDTTEKEGEKEKNDASPVKKEKKATGEK